MKIRILQIPTCLLSFCVICYHVSVAQVTLISSPYTQDFNAIGTGLPTGWTVRTGASATVLGTTATLVTATTAWNSTTGNFRNVASATGLLSSSTTTDQNSSSDRALAVRQVTATDVGVAFVLQLSNTTGITNISLSFKLQSLDNTVGRTATWKVDYGTGASPSTFTPVTSSPATLTTSPTWGSTDVTVNFGSALDNNASNVWIRIVTLTATTGSNTRPTSAIDAVQLSYTAGDFTPPTFTSTYPKVSNPTTSGFDLFTSLNEAGKNYFVVLPDGASAPSSSQVKNGQDASNNPLTTGFFGSINVSSPSTEYTLTLAGLSDNTDYDVYVVAEDIVPNLQAAPVKLDVRTNAIGDVTPPDFTSLYPKVDQVTANSFTVRTSLNELGKTYFVVLPGGASAPTSEQVKSGQDANGSIVSVNLRGSITVSLTSTEFTSAVTGLNASTSYDVYFAAEDNIPNLQTSPTKVSVTTGALFTESFNNCDGTASFSSYSVTGDQVWGCVDFGYNGTKGLRMNGFLGSAVTNEDWLISPVLNLSANASLSFYSQFSFAGPGLQLKISADYIGSGDPNSATWTSLNGNFPTVSVPSTSTALSDWTLSNVDLSAYTGTVFVAFVYTSTTGTNTAARWTLDEINFTNAVASYLSVAPSGLLFNSSGSVKSYTLKGINLQNDVSITAPTNFSVSKDNITFSTTISYTATEANAQQTVYAKFSTVSPSPDTFTGLITHTSTGVSPKNVSVAGTDKSLTFDIVAYNMEFFGTDVRDNTGVEFGPTDDALQVSNVTTVMQTIQSDIFGVEEISDDNAFNQLVAGLPGYAGISSNRWSHSTDPPDPFFPPQKVGFVYNTATVQLVSSRAMFSKLYDDIIAGNVTLPAYPTGTTSSFWSSGRLPFMATFDITINGVKRRIRMIDIHAKSAGSSTAQEDYNRRKYDAQVLYDSLNAHYANDNIIILGDFNDDVDVSIYNSSPSPYKMFVDDVANYNVITYPLSLTGASSFPSSTSLIDQIVASNELTNSYVNNSAAIEDARNYVPNYSNTTSDHLPVSARFLFSGMADQYITFTQLPNKTFGDAPFTITATSYSALPVSFSSSDPSVASISGNTVTILKAGTVNITASQAGDAYYNAASDVVQPLSINKSVQTINFAQPSAKNYGDAPFSVTASSTSGLTISYVSSDPSVASITGSTVTILKTGTINITASQGGNGNYNPAADVVQPLVINKASQTISLTAISPKTFGNAPLTFAPISTSGLPVSSASSNISVATITGTTVTITGVGTTTITASQAGNANYNAATDAQTVLTVNKASQTITFAAIADKTVGDPVFSLTATSSSSLDVGFITASDKITIATNQVTIVKAGRAVITASQNGNSNYNSASSVDQSFCIKPAKPTIAITNGNTPTPILTSNVAAGNQWYLNGSPISGATSNALTVTTAGVYKVQVKVDDCVSDFSTDASIVITGDLWSPEARVFAYPNPVENLLEISGLKNEVTGSQLFDMTGRMSSIVLEKKDEVYRTPVEYLTPGVYLLRIQEAGAVHQVKFIKK